VVSSSVASNQTPASVRCELTRMEPRISILLLMLLRLASTLGSK
jgi:hypothetical protein